MNVFDQTSTDRYAIYHGDCIEVMSSFPPQSVDFCVFSPPFLDLFAYSDNPRDLGNCQTREEFLEHFDFVVQQLARVVKSGRNVAVHVIDIPAMKERDGYIGLKDFPGDIIRAFERHDFIYHSRHTIWKDPLIEATRTKALGLMHKQLQKDSIMVRAGLPDYLLCFHNARDNMVPIAHPEGLRTYAGSNDPTRGERGIERSHNIFRAYASPVWMDIRQTYTLNARLAREAEDEKHLCPLQLDVIERCLTLWSNPDEVVLDPFGGIGSTAYGAVVTGRKALSIELKKSYYEQMRRTLEQARAQGEQETLFSLNGSRAAREQEEPTAGEGLFDE